MANERSLIASLYDFKIESFVAQRVLRFLYALLNIVISIFTIGFCLATIANPDEFSFLFIPLILLGGFVYLLLLRVWFEYLIVFFKIHQNTEKIAARDSI